MPHNRYATPEVLATGRALPEERIDEMAHVGVKVVNTK